MSISDSFYKIPKVLQDQVRSALRGVRQLPPEDITRYLAIYRQGISRIASRIGISGLDDASNVFSSERRNQLIPFQYIQMIQRLDEAFKALHKYNGIDGHLDYISQRTFSETQRVLGKSRAGSKSEKIKARYEEIFEYLSIRNYPSSTNKKALILAAAEFFECKERTVRKVASMYDLVNKQKRHIS